MFFTTQRVKLVRFLIKINESIFFYKRLKKIFKEIFKNSPLRKVIHVGVNRGQTIRFLHQFSEEIEVVGFEPNKSLFVKVREMKLRNVSLHNYVCSDSEATLEFNNFSIYKEIKHGFGSFQTLFLLTIITDMISNIKTSYFE